MLTRYVAIGHIPASLSLVRVLARAWSRQRRRRGRL
jgi:hypothetical protein